ncbi:hypothetical protein FC95_GL000003 [Lentilactobacillus kefiri DSM 20587 = JCM 5818]|uniref:HNH nuclease domain-containing protein n=2 Tax=Lentilactobacillus kefiri TaxID=33962 RepID=A0A8E1RLA8_LENKE|nr:HNH endonuclease signature motif containing protein [Lentilactobacillus kefiri]KRL64765.1 hypothetical protein FD08_GL002140 [Lentilactobacillus parakefiri DSM 10551]KRM53961.1 hypothetical protein FC95_GL000003 [Lentilactobacillus kefiri DSM 20587 = JCM 5818]
MMIQVTINNKFQKREGTYKEILNNGVLDDLVKKVTGHTDYDVKYIDKINKGRLVVIEQENEKDFVCLSDDCPAGRNSYFQSFPTTVNKYILDKHTNKRIFYYNLPTPDKTNIETDYHRMMYRLMATIGTEFLNATEYLKKPIVAFNSVADFIRIRTNELSRQQNNSTYVTVDESSNTVIYGKVYGANKYETTLISIAMNALTMAKTTLYEFVEKNLKELPKASRNALEKIGIKIVKIDSELEKHEFEKGNSLRSPKYISNLLAIYGPKHCAFCDCDIPQLIQGAHIYPVADIKKLAVPLEKKIEMATDGKNGLWLCNNHHKLLDSGIITLSTNGDIKINTEALEKTSLNFIKNSLVLSRLPEDVITPNFVSYLNKRISAAS